ncbi:hypothetical protein FSP39_019063 [Pinctada imbricata]|uniref:PH domain-containing protein n=1 Tax=Pinctada imbricata TaxID=66713 RepID=A0AA88YHF3_PINIB|nr:hypothetical protein FSP39_019063 [Pinctada imbricata]
MSLQTSDDDVVIIKAGYIFRQKTFFRKWKKSWLVVCLGGAVRVYRNRNSKKPQKSYNIKQDCIVIKTGRQCHYLLPPNGVDSQGLIELVLTGDRAVKLCGQDPEIAMMWLHAFQRAQSDKELPTPRWERRNLNKEEVLNLEHKSCWYACCRNNKIEEL